MRTHAEPISVTRLSGDLTFTPFHPKVSQLTYLSNFSVGVSLIGICMRLRVPLNMGMLTAYHNTSNLKNFYLRWKLMHQLDL